MPSEEPEKGDKGKPYFYEIAPLLHGVPLGCINSLDSSRRPSADKQPHPVTWNWGSGQPGGTVAETKTEGDIAITSKRGNKVKKNAEPSNPAVHVERSGNDVVKKASELNVVEKANGSSGTDGKQEPKTESNAGDKRKHDETEKDSDKADKPEDRADKPLEENADGKTVKAKDNNKKQKKEAKEEKKAEEPIVEKGKRGRPKKADGALPKAKKEPTPRSTEGIGSRTRSRGA
ncbi:uncharacterized protein A1O9_02963 [Exophiala aquamarina CBS 119918]|uniref:Hypervirulence associated protein TUDOR domain-containing protein n=1 Tax=Exophiala aquamarina CBS 119918 TaxID=1182545 RepID=A0A072PNT5_9EURO|nr:uncharacterized protein A1O9_02963 [Exophiala aquamarina CBS 119918]KEF61397.1 hypothetical protein A1O9_02963 [Exophiala aquamarina CBS 119918]